MTGKRTKASVNYRNADTKERCCHTCKYSYGPHVYRQCRLVAGRIQPDDLCDLWTKSPHGYGALDDDDDGDHEYR
jgi:hypothetical protein